MPYRHTTISRLYNCLMLKIVPNQGLAGPGRFTEAESLPLRASPLVGRSSMPLRRKTVNAWMIVVIVMLFVVALFALWREDDVSLERHSLSPLTFNTARNASCGISTRPTRFIRFLPAFCFSSNLRLREISPP
jgi:hypothetical protein